jgi:hypothetical protein
MLLWALQVLTSLISFGFHHDARIIVHEQIGANGPLSAHGLRKVSLPSCWKPTEIHHDEAGLHGNPLYRSIPRSHGAKNEGFIDKTLFITFTHLSTFAVWGMGLKNSASVF